MRNTVNCSPVQAARETNRRRTHPRPVAIGVCVCMMARSVGNYSLSVFLFAFCVLETFFQPAIGQQDILNSAQNSAIRALSCPHARGYIPVHVPARGCPAPSLAASLTCSSSYHGTLVLRL